MIHSKPRSKGLKLQKLQGYFFKSVGLEKANVNVTIRKSNVTKNLQGLKNNENQTTNEIRKNVGTLIDDCTDAIATLSHVNTTGPTRSY